VGSFPRADAPLDPPLPEVALVGRSNVGKSSLLNVLAGRKIARVSGTPGKTRMLNVYLMPLLHGEWYVGASPHHAFYFLDLPGYGYSKASKADRVAFRGLVSWTLDRARLAGVLWLLDVRRDPSDEDRDMQDQFAVRGTRVLAAVTKSDKLPRMQRERRGRELPRALALDQDQVVVTSARTGEGITELQEAIASLVEGLTA